MGVAQAHVGQGSQSPVSDVRGSPVTTGNPDDGFTRASPVP